MRKIRPWGFEKIKEEFLASVSTVGPYVRNFIDFGWFSDGNWKAGWKAALGASKCG